METMSIKAPRYLTDMKTNQGAKSVLLRPRQNATTQVKPRYIEQKIALMYRHSPASCHPGSVNMNMNVDPVASSNLNMASGDMKSDYKMTSLEVEVLILKIYPGNFYHYFFIQNPKWCSR